MFSRSLPFQHSFARLGDNGPHVLPKGIADTKQSVERRIPGGCFHAAYQRLAETGPFSERIPGNPLPLPLLNEELHDLGTDFVMQNVLCHARFLNGQWHGNAYH